MCVRGSIFFIRSPDHYPHVEWGWGSFKSAKLLWPRSAPCGVECLDALSAWPQMQPVQKERGHRVMNFFYGLPACTCRMKLSLKMALLTKFRIWRTEYNHLRLYFLRVRTNRYPVFSYLCGHSEIQQICMIMGVLTRALL